ncbi:hypothetical protein [Pseudanabaena sp. FACHB-2040]|uniref:hypothetical protein n=1 Tax=Pseudanabaena sp. FACHB-2040 TaxID=2692859 RepID=UPI0016881E60|nr:hypothetical protein [Pseudanabaena sp. FACHB-2040]MBD2259597.1 hypothetical protein [Pseudanabaena sp. FACHB-2040]
MEGERLGRYLTLGEFCTCTQTYRRFADVIDPWPRQDETLQALRDLNHYLLDPLIDAFGWDGFQLTYGFCSVDLKKFLAQRDPVTGKKYGRVDPSRDQHMAHERNRNGRLYCSRLGAACDFWVAGVGSDRILDWLLNQALPFDSIYYYGPDRPLHLSYGPEHKRAIWTFSAAGIPTQRGLERWQP